MSGVRALQAVDIYVTWTVTSVISDTEWETSLRSSIAPLYQTLVNTHRHLRYIRTEMRIMFTKAHVWNPIGSCDYVTIHLPAIMRHSLSSTGCTGFCRNDTWLLVPPLDSTELPYLSCSDKSTTGRVLIKCAHASSTVICVSWDTATRNAAYACPMRLLPLRQCTR